MNEAKKDFFVSGIMAWAIGSTFHEQIHCSRSDIGFVHLILDKILNSPIQIDTFPESDNIYLQPSLISGEIMHLLLLTSMAFSKPPTLPKKGNIALGFNAVPILNYALNAANFAVNTGQDANGLVDFPTGFSNVIMAKYFLNKKSAIRITLAPNFVSTSVAEDYDSPVDLGKIGHEDHEDFELADVNSISDITNTSAYDIVIGAGYEMRRGKGRLHGVYGAGVFVGLAGASETTQYGYAYNNDADKYGVIGDGSQRTTSTQYGSTTSFGLRGFGGIEYFIGNRISLSAEYGLALGREKTGRGTVSIERWEADEDEEDQGKKKTDTKPAGGEQGSLVFGVDNGTNKTFSSSTGALMLNFHF